VSTLNNNSEIKCENGSFQRFGDPTEAALKVFAEKIGQYDSSFSSSDYTKNPNQYSEILIKTTKEICTLEFSNDRKCMSRLVNSPDLSSSSNSLLLKGAPEKVIEKCDNIKFQDGTIHKLSQSDKEVIMNSVQNFAKQALRCIGLAINYQGGGLKNDNETSAREKLGDFSKYNEYESGCTFLGFVGIKDPIRNEVVESIEMCKTAGIRVIMITGDSKYTGEAIAKECGIIEDSTG
jgi:Ca2+-transporting ATPase